MINIYCCGLTPYGPPHVGHARTLMVATLLKAVLANLGHSVRLAVNWTDIDPKIGVYARHETCLRVADIQVEYSRRWLKRLVQWTIDFEPRVSMYLREISINILRLQARKLTVTRLDGIYMCSHRHSCTFGHRSVVTEGGFALWRSRQCSGVRSPIGRGVPGWHLECATMINSIFGSGVAIHLGGRDLREVHHPNEDMLYKSLWGQRVSDVWMHVGLVRQDGDKMSKSRGNFTSIEASLRLSPPLHTRLKLLSLPFYKDCSFSEGDLRRIERYVPTVSISEAWPDALVQRLFEVRASQLLIRKHFNLLYLIRYMSYRYPTISTTIWLTRLGISDSRCFASQIAWWTLQRMLNLRSEMRRLSMYGLADVMRVYLEGRYCVQIRDVGKGTRVHIM